MKHVLFTWHLRKFLYYLYDAKVCIKCDHATLHKFLTVHTLNTKQKDWGTEIADISHVMLEHMKGMENILANHISCLRCVALYDSLDLKGEGKEFGHTIFEELLPFLLSLPRQNKVK